MKLYHAYKKQFSRVRALDSGESLKLSLSILLLGLLLVPALFSSAQSVDDLKNKISQKDSDIQKLEQEIAAYQRELDSIGTQKDSLSRSIKELDITKKKLTADIGVTNKKIDKTN